MLKKMATEAEFAKDFENFRKRCFELEEKRKKDEIRCLMLETEVENLKKKNHELEEKIAVIRKVTVDLTDVKNDSSNLEELMIENKVLECEKRKAETDLFFWKEKVKELESKINGMNEKVKEDVNVVSKGTEEVFHGQVRKRLPFEKLAPSTPGVGQSPFHVVIDISDEDANYNEIPKVENVSSSRKCGDLTKSQPSPENNLQKTNQEHSGEEHVDEFRVCSSNTRSSKRKRAAKIVTSDDENGYDDNAPICMLKTRHSSRVMTDSEEEVKENVSRRYPTRLRKSESKNKQDESIDLNTVNSSEDEEGNDGVDESESEDESLGGFIVDSSESVSNCDSESSDSDESKDKLNEYKETLEIIGRKKNPNLNWELEGDMLSDFGKDAELCMSAVCALYRQQTADEKASKVTRYQNERGFSQTDALRGSKLADFLTDGDPNGVLNKTVKELKEYDSKGIKLCRTLATKYSKQLFSIYQNKEDPYFPPKR